MSPFWIGIGIGLLFGILAGAIAFAMLIKIELERKGRS
jgi:hypothetical protein